MVGETAIEARAPEPWEAEEEKEGHPNEEGSSYSSFCWVDPLTEEEREQLHRE